MRKSPTYCMHQKPIAESKSSLRSAEEVQHAIMRFGFVTGFKSEWTHFVPWKVQPGVAPHSKWSNI